MGAAVGHFERFCRTKIAKNRTVLVKNRTVLYSSRPILGIKRHVFRGQPANSDTVIDANDGRD